MPGGASTTATDAAEVGLIGLGVMGRNIALNLADAGLRVVGWDADADARAAAAIPVADGPDDLARRLRRPRALLLMLPAGAAVDEVLAALLPHLQDGDVVADGGNANYRDSDRRAGELRARGLGYLGLGISGGEAGARRGASIMAGGDAAAYARFVPLLEAIAARVEGTPCVAHLGPDGAGHFVKTLHNGIEYALMQLIAESAYLMRHLGGLAPEAMAEVFARWNRGSLESYLIGIAGMALAARDFESGRPLVDVIRDRAGEKGTGRWAAIAAIELGVAAPSLAEAAIARAVTALPRAAEAGALAPVEASEAECAALVANLEVALLAASLCCYIQGFQVLAAAGRAYGWPLPLPEIARIWRGGCIIRARLLDNVMAALARAPEPLDLLDDPSLASVLADGAGTWRRVVLAATAKELPVPVLSATLAWLDARNRPRLWADLIQAQRDCFGRHGFERVDKPGLHHFDWSRESPP